MSPPGPYIQEFRRRRRRISPVRIALAILLLGVIALLLVIAMGGLRVA